MGPHGMVAPDATAPYSRLTRTEAVTRHCTPSRAMASTATALQRNCSKAATASFTGQRVSAALSIGAPFSELKRTVASSVSCAHYPAARAIRGPWMEVSSKATMESCSARAAAAAASTEARSFGSIRRAADSHSCIASALARTATRPGRSLLEAMARYMAPRKVVDFMEEARSSKSTRTAPATPYFAALVRRTMVHGIFLAGWSKPQTACSTERLQREAALCFG